MACAQQSAAEYLRNARADLVTRLKNFPLITENLYQRKVLNGSEVDALKAERRNFDKARFILDCVSKKGEGASYELLRILDITRKRTLHQDSHHWICCFPFREDTEADYSVGTKPCHDYQKQLKTKALNILRKQWEQCSRRLKHKTEGKFTFVPVVLDTDTNGNSAQSKIKKKNNKCKKLRHKKLRSYLPVQKQKLSPDDLLHSREKAILLIGKPGIGKTSLVQEMLSIWSQKDSRVLDYMFYFDEATLAQIWNLMSLESLLFDLNCKPLEKDRKEVWQDIEEHSENVIIVFDGINTTQKNPLLQKILDGDLLPEAKIVITCRSELEDDSFLSDWPAFRVYVQGFSEESVRIYLAHMLCSEAEILNIVLNNQELISLCHVPMYAFMVATCSSFSNLTAARHPLTITEMYVHILRQDLKKAGNKTFRQIDKYMKDIRDQLFSLMESAFSATLQKTVNLPNIDSDEIEISKVFLRKITVEATPTSVKEFHAFLHSTVQEFFSALWLLGNPDEIDKILQLCLAEEQKHLKHLIPFICGLLSQQNLDLLKNLFLEDQIRRASDGLFMKVMNTFVQHEQIMGDEDDVNAVFVCQCLYESQSPKSCLLFLEKVNYHLDLSGNDLDPHQCCAVSYVISQSSSKQVHLSLEDCIISDTGVEMILRTTPHLAHLGKAGKFLNESSEKICLHLHCRQGTDQISSAACSMIFEALPRINSLRFEFPDNSLIQTEHQLQIIESIQRDLVLRAAVFESNGQQSGIVSSVLKFFQEDPFHVCDFLIKLQSLVKTDAEFDCLKKLYGLIPAVWIVDLSERKSSLLLEVLKLQTVKKPVELRGCSDEESEVMSFLQCLPFISQLSFMYCRQQSAVLQFLVKLIAAAVEWDAATGQNFTKPLAFVCTYTTFPFFENECDPVDQCAFLLDLYSHVKDYETETGRSVLPALQPVYQSAPAVWIIDLSERKSPLFLEVLRLQTVKKPVKLRGWSDEENEMRSFLQCLPYISQLRFKSPQSENDEWRKKVNSFLLDLCLQAALHQIGSVQAVEKLISCTHADVEDFLLDLYSHVRDYEWKLGRSVLPALQPVYQSVPAVWNINLSERKSSLFLEVLKLQTVKKPVKLRGWSVEESVVRIFLQCLPYISQLSFEFCRQQSTLLRFLVKLIAAAAEWDSATGQSLTKLLTFVCTYTTFPFDEDDDYTNTADQCEFLLDLFSHVKKYETETGRSVLPALQPVYQSAPEVWNINLKKSKSSLFLEVLKLQTSKKPVVLRGWSDEEGVVRRFLQCMPYISQLRFRSPQSESDEWRERVKSFLLNLSLQATLLQEDPFESIEELSCADAGVDDFLLDLFSHMKKYETKTGRSVLPALQPVYRSSPAVWNIDLSETKSSLFLEVLKFQTVKKPVKLRGWSDEESEVRKFLQYLPYISQLSFKSTQSATGEWRKRVHSFLLDLCLQAAVHQKRNIHKTVEKLMSYVDGEDFLLDLYSHLKDYEIQTGMSVLPALQPVYQSAPAVWIIDLSKRKSSLLLEVLKLQTVKKPVKLRGWSVEESEVRSFLQCLPYISQLSFTSPHSDSVQWRKRVNSFLLDLCLQAALHQNANIHTTVEELMSCACGKKGDFLLDLYSHVKKYETETGRSVLPALQPVYQSAPKVWIIDLSERKSSLLLEVLRLQSVKKPVVLRGWSDEESEVMSFLQCLPFISQLSFMYCRQQSAVLQFLVKLIAAAVEWDAATGQSFTKPLAFVCTYTTFPFFENECDPVDQCAFLLDLFSHVKDYETETGRSVLPALQPVYQSAPAVWIIDLRKRKSSLLLDVLRLQSVKKPVVLRGCSDEESEVRSFLQCLPFISQLSFMYCRQQSAILQFLVKLIAAAVEWDAATGQNFTKPLAFVCTYTTFPFFENECNPVDQCAFLLDLYSHVKDYETETGRSVLPALQPVYQSAPEVWIIDLSERKIPLFLEVLKLQTVKKPVELRGWSDEENEMRSFLQCLPYISQLRFKSPQSENDEWRKKVNSFLLDLCLQAALHQIGPVQAVEKLISCTHADVEDFLLDLYSHVRDYEWKLGRSVLPALQPVYQSVPAVWNINLSERKSSLFLEVLKLQTVKKPVKLRGWSVEESVVRIFLQCLPYISQLSFEFCRQQSTLLRFLVKLIAAAAEWDSATGQSLTKLLTFVCTYTTFPFDEDDDYTNTADQCEFLLDLFSHVKKYETETGRSVLPALQPVYQSAPEVWNINLKKSKSSLFLEVLKLQTSKKPVVLRGWSDEEGVVRRFLQCMPYISQLRFRSPQSESDEWRERVKSFLLNLSLQATLLQEDPFESIEELSCADAGVDDFLLDLFSHMKKYETKTGRSVLPALQPVYRSAPAVWNIDLSEKKSSLLLEVLKFQTVKKPVVLRGWSDEESEVRRFLQYLPYISQLSFKSTQSETGEWRKRVHSFLLDLCLQAAVHQKKNIHKTVEKLMSYVDGEDFLLDLYSHLKDYEIQTGRSVLPALQPVYQSAPAVWNIDLSKRKSSLLLEVLKLQTVKKPVELRGWSVEESEVRSFLQCLPYVSQLSFTSPHSDSVQWRKRVNSFLLDLCLQAALHQNANIHTTVEELMSCACGKKGDFLLDLYSHVKKYETETGRSVLPALQPVYQSAPAVWIIDLSERKSSLLLEVLKLQTVKKPVVLRGWSDEESEVRSFLQCLPFISQLSFMYCRQQSAVLQFLVKLIAAAVEWDAATGQNFTMPLAFVCTYTTFPFFENECDPDDQCAFLLDLYSHVKKFETETGRSVLPLLQSVYQSAPAVWIIDLSERKSSLLLEVLRLQSVKKPVVLRGWSDEESEVRSFLQCLPFISQLSFMYCRQQSAVLQFLVKLIAAAVEWDAATGQNFTKPLAFVCTYTTFPFFENECDPVDQCAFLLDLYSHVKDYETETGMSVLPALQPVYQSAPEVWIIDLSERKIPLFLEVLKLQTVKKPVELRGWSDEENEIRSFLQCLPYISQLRFKSPQSENDEWRKKVNSFLLDLCLQAALHQIGSVQAVEKLISCTHADVEDFLLDLYSHVRDYEWKLGRSVLPALQPVYQSVPAVWNINLSERKSSLFLEVLKLQTVKKPVKLRGWSVEESVVRIFLQCLPYISQLSFEFCRQQSTLLRFLVKLIAAAAEWDSATGQSLTKLLTFVCTYTTFPFDEDDDYTNTADQCEFLLDLFSHVKKYETETGRSVLPALQPVYQSAPEVWNINLKKSKSSLFLEVLKLQTSKKPVVLRGWSDEEGVVRRFLQCMPYISQLRFRSPQSESDEWRERVKSFLLNLSLQATLLQEDPFESIEELSCADAGVDDFLLDLFSHMKKYETKTGRSVLPALQPVYRSAPAVWNIDLSETKSSLFLEVLKFQTVKKPVVLRGWSDEESEVRRFLQYLPYISQLSFKSTQSETGEWRKRVHSFLLDLCLQAAVHQKKNIHKTVEKLMSYVDGEDFLLDLYSHLKDYEIKTGMSVLPALQIVYQSAPAVWNIDLSKRKSSLLLEVLKLQTVKKPVELRGWSVEESEVRSFLQCLPYVSQLSFTSPYSDSVQWRKRVNSFLLDLCLQAALHQNANIHTTVEELMSCACGKKGDFLLDLYSHVKKYETETGRSVLPALQPVYQSAPEVWIIDLSERKSSLLLEVLKLQTVKKPVELRGWSDEESEVMSFLQCLPFISQLSFMYCRQQSAVLQFLVKLIAAAVEWDAATGQNFTKPLAFVCTYTTFPFFENECDPVDQCAFLLDLYSHVNDYETETGKSVLPALQPVYQSAPAVWIIDLRKRKSSLLLDVLKLQTVKKPVELRDGLDKEIKVRRFFQCLPYISQLRFGNNTSRHALVQFLVKLISAAAECDTATGQSFTKLLTSVCTYKSFPFKYGAAVHCDFLLELYSHVKKYETETGRSVLPALQSVYQSAPAVWIIDLSERKSSLFLEVLKLQTVKKPVEVRGCSDEESEVRSFLQCLPFISQLSFMYCRQQSAVLQFLVKLIAAAVEWDAATGQSFTKPLAFVCTYTTFPFFENECDPVDQCAFLLDLYSHVKKYETETGRSVLPVLQPVYQSAPEVWIIDLSERKSSLLLEVLKLQTVKKPVELRGWSVEESEVRSFLQCLPFISQLSGAEECFLSLCKVLWTKPTAEQVASLLQALGFTLSLGEKLSTSSCRAVGRVLGLSTSRLNLTLNPLEISLRGARVLFRHIKHLHTLKLSGSMVVKMVKALRAVRASVPVSVEELSLDLSRTQQSVRELSRVLSSLASLLRLWNVQCVNLSEHTMEVQSLIVLLCHQGSLTIRLSNETLQQLLVVVYEAQEEEFTQCFLQKVGGDLTPCSLNWKMIQYFLQYHCVTVDFRKSNIKQQNIRELLTVLDRVQLRRLSTSFVLSIIREIYETGSAHSVSCLLSSAENFINLNNRDLYSVHWAALCFTLQHCSTVSLSLLWASIPEGELERIVPLLNHISNLSVDRLLLLRLLHCCSVSEGTAAAVLLSALQHRLDFSCSSTLDLTAHTNTLTLSTEDCRVISTTIQRASTHTQLSLQDCEIEDAGVEQLITIIHKVSLSCSKALLLQFLTLVHVWTESECVRRAVSLSQALGEEVDLSHTPLDLQACRSLALVLEHCEGLSELDLSHCQLTDHCLELLLPHLHKICVLDLNNNNITDHGAGGVHRVVSSNSHIQTVRLFNNRITQKQLFMSDQRFEIW
ncbi:uncharacterized protein [Salminus brasiliensis]|uniref:uncharacterized protein isoform X2 n=1 Tax=Salminus brasiliensis TaxID=930266 RepID=UPI003B835054